MHRYFAHAWKGMTAGESMIFPGYMIWFISFRFKGNDALLWNSNFSQAIIQKWYLDQGKCIQLEGLWGGEFSDCPLIKRIQNTKKKLEINFSIFQFSPVSTLRIDTRKINQESFSFCHFHDKLVVTQVWCPPFSAVVLNRQRPIVSFWPKRSNLSFDAFK